MLVIPLTGSVFSLDTLRTVLAGALVKLYKNDLTPTPATVLANLTEADYTGYVAYTVTAWGAVTVNVDQQAETVAPSHQFQGTGTAVGNTLYGYWIEASTGELVAVERFASPQTIASAADGFVLVPVLTLQSQAA